MADQETELKFVFAPQDREKVEAAPILKDALSAARRRHLTARYFDTPDKDLWTRGISLRLRDDEDGRVQTLKQEAASTVERGQWGKATQSEAPDIDAIVETPLGSLFRKKRLRQCLQPNFDVEVDRVSADLEFGEAHIEVAVDEGFVESGTNKVAVNELELELKDGDKNALFALGRMLADQSPISLSVISKAERGYLVADGAWGHSAKATKPRLACDMKCDEAFEAICRACLHDFILNTQALETPDRVEGVHRSRIALRRLRAALQLFEPVVFDDSYPELNDELKWIAHLLGETRDLDVFQETTFLPAAKDDAIQGAKLLADHMELKRNASHETVNAAVKSSRLHALLINFVAWLEVGNWRRNSTEREELVEEFAAATLKRRYKKLVKQGADLENLKPTQRHKIRIRAKKLRYMLSFFGGVDIGASSKSAKRLSRCLEDVQACLGEVHDDQAKAEFLANEVKSLPEGENHLLAFAAGALAQSSRRTGQSLANSVRAFKELADLAPF